MPGKTYLETLGDQETEGGKNDLKSQTAFIYRYVYIRYLIHTERLLAKD